MDNKSLEPRSCLRFDPILEDEAEYPASHLKQKQDCKEYRIGRQQGSVLSESSNTTSESNYESDSPGPDEDERRIQCNVGQFREVVESVLLSPGPDTNSKNPQPQQPKYDIEAKNNIFKAARDLAGVSHSPSPLLVLRVRRRHLLPIGFQFT
eukprot:GFUD01039788.1.p2 GENE.GFUD01039788.1~~GFUD01039788.1.p2  ORF type:complete len:152 (-),score=26.94 GFUD01039788.1:60-515(-)